MLRSQKFDPSHSKPFAQVRKEVAELIPNRDPDDVLREIVQRDTIFHANENLFVIFIGNSTSRDRLREVLIGFAGERGLTCKLEGKAIIRSASSELSIQMKIGFNNEKERMVHIINVVDFLGGDKGGKKFQYKFWFKLSFWIVSETNWTNGLYFMSKCFFFFCLPVL